MIAYELEVLKVTENRYSGIPTIRRTMQEYGLPNLIFLDERGSFVVKFLKWTIPPSCYSGDGVGLLDKSI